MGTSLRLVRLLVAAGVVFLLSFPGSAGGATSNETVPFTITVPNPCTGEEVVVTGKMHMLVVSNDNKFEITTNWTDTTGIALVSGTKYQANETTHFYVVSAPGDSFTVALHDSFELVSLSPTPNFLVHVTIGVRFDPSTGNSAQIERGAGAECSGPMPAP
jgi:hypothetical protein